MSTPESDQAITQAGLEALEAELAELEGPVRVELAKKIKTAREEGDLSENADTARSRTSRRTSRRRSRACASAARWRSSSRSMRGPISSRSGVRCA